MMPLIERLEKETGVSVERVETWHNEANAKRLEEMDKDGACGGVPFFINTKTGKTICGEASYEELKEWTKE
jgi:hypothetical protein